MLISNFLLILVGTLIFKQMGILINPIHVLPQTLLYSDGVLIGFICLIYWIQCRRLFPINKFF